VHKGDAGAVGTGSRRLPGEAQPSGGSAGDRRLEIGDTECEVMNRLAPAVDKLPERSAGRQGLDELDLGRSHRHKGDGYALPGHGRAIPDGEAERRKRDDRLRVKIPDNDREMGETRGGTAHTTAEGR